jgi:tetratricopeptide (TPR) repeat protein
VCPFCGTELHLDASGVPEVRNLVTLAQAAYAAGNFTEALTYCNKALELDVANPEVWLGKAVATGRLSTLTERRFQEMEDTLRRGLALVTDARAGWVLRQQACAAIGDMVPSFFEAARVAYVQQRHFMGAWMTFAQQCTEVVQLLRLATWLDPTNQAVLIHGVRICHYCVDALPAGAEAESVTLWSSMGPFFEAAWNEFKAALNPDG